MESMQISDNKKTHQSGFNGYLEDHINDILSSPFRCHSIINGKFILPKPRIKHKDEMKVLIYG